MIVRASKLGDFMTAGTRKGELFGKTAQAYVRELWLNQNTGRKKLFSTKHTRKGSLLEEAAISLYLDVYGGDFAAKNTAVFINDSKTLTGTPDIILPDTVIDTKVSWDIFTYLEAGMTKDYEWQLQAYMHLTKKTKAKLVYALLDTPSEFVAREKFLASFEFGENYEEDPEYRKVSEQIELNHTYGDIPKEQRLKVFDIERNPDFEELFTAQYERAYDYYLTLKLN